MYASNHTSYFDVLPLMLGLGVPYRFVAKMEVRGMPFIGTFLRQMGHLWFDRTDPNSRLRQAEKMEGLLRQGDASFWFSQEPVRAGRRGATVPTRRIQGRGVCRRADHSGIAGRNAPLSARRRDFASTDTRDDHFVAADLSETNGRRAAERRSIRLARFDPAA